jgi:hypothetical protein
MGQGQINQSFRLAPLVPARAGTQRTKFLTLCVALNPRWSLPLPRAGTGV